MPTSKTIQLQLLVLLDCKQESM